VGRQTVYRRWPSKGALIAAATLNGAVDVQRPKVAQTPDLPRDLESWLMALAAGWGTTEEASLVRALSAAAADDATIAAELYLRLTGPQHDALVSRMRAAQEAGDVTADADIEAAADALIGGLLYVVLARHESVTRQRARGLLTIVLSGLQRKP
jgi:AcrR family transcriptional regulator